MSAIRLGQRLTVRIESLIEEIIQRYEPFVRNSPYLFPIITSNDPEEAFRQYQTALGYHNPEIEETGEVDRRKSTSLLLYRKA